MVFPNWKIEKCKYEVDLRLKLRVFGGFASVFEMFSGVSCCDSQCPFAF